MAYSAQSYQKEGYNQTQAKQLSYLDHQNDKEIRFGGWRTSYEVSCRSCQESKHFGAADNARRFIESHKNHKTWVSVVKN